MNLRLNILKKCCYYLTSRLSSLIKLPKLISLLSYTNNKIDEISDQLSMTETMELNTYIKAQ